MTTEVSKQKSQMELGTKESILIKNELSDCLAQNSQLESNQEIIFQEFSALQKEYNKVLVDFELQEAARFKLEEVVNDLERKLLVNKKQKDTIVHLLQEKEKVAF